MPAASLAPDTDLRAIEGIDSVKVLRMIARIEREYDVELDDEEVFALTTVEGTVVRGQGRACRAGHRERA